MKLSTSIRIGFAAAWAAMAMTSQAALVDAPLPANAYITRGDLQWAWASPVAADGSFIDFLNPDADTRVDLSYQDQFGWRLPTAQELALAPLAPDFVFEGANVPRGASAQDPVSGAFNSSGFRPGGVPMACATPYFSNWAPTCNYSNAPGSNGPDALGNLPRAFNENSMPWWGQPGATAFSESLVVRDLPTVGAVPEPTTVALMAMGLVAAVGVARRRRG